MSKSKNAVETVFQFKRPVFHDVSDAAALALGVGLLSHRLANEERTRLEHHDGRAENVAEHSLMLAKIAPELAVLLYPELDHNLVARYATLHDDVEAYVGDTATDFISEEGLKQKKIREEKGIARLRQEYSSLSTYIDLIDTYEAQQVPEARFVRVADKMMPILFHFTNSGKVLKRKYNRETYLDPNSRSPTNDRLLKEYPEFEKLIELRKELTTLMARMHL